jgi:chromosome segregation ATPase
MSIEKILIFTSILLVISVALNILIYLEIGKIKSLTIGILEELSNHYININGSIEKLSTQILSNNQQTQKNLEDLKREIINQKEEAIERLSNQISLNKQQIQENLKELKDEIMNQKEEIQNINEKADENNKKTEHIIKLLKEPITEEDLK